MQAWTSLLVCNFAVLASAFFRLSSTTPDGTIYSSSGKRVGVLPPQQSFTNFSPPRTASDGNGEELQSGDVELSNLDVTVDLELSDVMTVSMARTSLRSPSPPPSGLFEVQNVDSGV